MALRPVSELGLADATDVVTLEEAAGTAPQPSPSGDATPLVKRSRPPRRPERREPRRAAGPPMTAESAQWPAVALADEPTTFLQIMVPGELHERLTEVSHLLGAEHRKLRHQKTILAALIWRHVLPGDADRLRELGALLDAYLQTDVSEAPAEIKVGAHVSFSLKYGLDGAALALRRTRRAAFAKTLVSALIWRHVESADLGPLVELLAAYREASRPEPKPLC